MTLGNTRNFRYPQPLPSLPLASSRKDPNTGRVEFNVGNYVGRLRRTGACRACSAAIAWVETALGKKMPLDLATERFDSHAYWYESHFARCPKAEVFRRAKRAQESRRDAAGGSEPS